MIEDLIANAEKFMDDNLIIVSGAYNAESKVPIPMKLIPMGTVEKINGGQANYYQLYCGTAKVKENEAQKGELFEAYWCHYEPGSTFYTFLGNEAQLMFTATMNGCSFGIGMPNPSGNVLVVGHSNLPGAAEADQNKLLTQGLGGGQGTVLTATFYRGQTENWVNPVMNVTEICKTLNDATTFGVFKDNKWTFYTQLYCRKSVLFNYINRMNNKPMQGTENKVHLVGSAEICSRTF